MGMQSRKSTPTSAIPHGTTPGKVAGREYYRVTGKPALMKITIWHKDRKLVNVILYQDTTIKRLREIIFENRQIPKEVQTLTFEGTVLEDNYFLQKDYRIQDGNVIVLSLPLGYHQNFKIFLKLPSDDMIKVIVNEDDKVIKLKEVITEVEGIPVEEQTLSFLSWVLEDERKIKEYDLKKSSIVRVLQKPTEPQWVECGIQMTPQSQNSEASFALHNSEFNKMKDNVTQMTPRAGSLYGDENGGEYHSRNRHYCHGHQEPADACMNERRNSIITMDDEEEFNMHPVQPKTTMKSSRPTPYILSDQESTNKSKTRGLVRTPVTKLAEYKPRNESPKLVGRDQRKVNSKPPAAPEPPKSSSRQPGESTPMHLKSFAVKRPNVRESGKPTNQNGAPKNLQSYSNFNFAKTLLEKKLTGSIDMGDSGSE